MVSGVRKVGTCPLSLSEGWGGGTSGDRDGYGVWEDGVLHRQTYLDLWAWWSRDTFLFRRHL